MITIQYLRATLICRMKMVVTNCVTGEDAIVFVTIFWNYAKLISGILRYGMPLENVIALISSLQLDSDNMNTWVSGVAKALKRYVNATSADQENIHHTDETDE